MIPLLVVSLLLSSVSAEQWTADIDYLASELPKRHPNPFTITSRDAFNAQLAELKAQLPDLSDAEVAIRLQQAVASLHDGHTSVDTNIAPATWFPLRFYLFPDGIYVTKTNDESRMACGARLIAIDGMPADEVYVRVAATISAENEQWPRYRAPIAMARAEVLKAVGVIASTETATFTFERFSLTLHAGPALPEFDQTTPDLPLYRRNPERRYWYTWDAEERVLYLKYNACANDPANPFVNVEKELLAIVDREQVDFFVIDVRDNSGGSTEVARNLINEIRRRPALRGHLFVIIGRKTFSSALLNAIDLDQLAGATLIGEPTGGKPNAFGEVKLFALPNSKLTVFHSSKHFSLVPENPPSLEPDVRVEITAAEFFRRRDPVLEAILSPLQISAASSGRRRAVGVSALCPQ